MRNTASVWSVCAAPSRNAGAGAEPKTGGGGTVRVTQFPDEPALEQLSFADVLQPVILNLNGDHVGNRLCTGYVSLEEVG